MNEVEFMTILGRPDDIDYFRIKSQNLSNEGTLKITLNRNPFGKVIESYLGLGYEPSGFRVLHNDGTYSTMIPSERSSNFSWTASDYFVFSLSI